MRIHVHEYIPLAVKPIYSATAIVFYVCTQCGGRRIRRAGEILDMDAYAWSIKAKLIKESDTIEYVGPGFGVGAWRVCARQST